MQHMGKTQGIHREFHFNLSMATQIFLYPDVSATPCPPGSCMYLGGPLGPYLAPNWSFRSVQKGIDNKKWLIFLHVLPQNYD